MGEHSMKEGIVTALYEPHAERTNLERNKEGRLFFSKGDHSYKIKQKGPKDR